MNERIKSLDALRGFALLGILIANMLYFQYNDILFANIQPDGWLDKGAFYFTKIAVEGSFYPIFGFLFGYGVIQFVRALERKELATKWPLRRRALGLIILGILHIAFVWDGDILVTYGTWLLIFAFFIRCTVKTLIVWASLLIVLSLPLSLFLTGITGFLEEDSNLAIDIYKYGTFADVFHYRIGGILDLTSWWFIILVPIFLIFVAIIAFFAVGPFILLGMAAAKVALFTTLDQQHKGWKYLSLFVPVGLLLKSCMLFENAIGGMLFTLGTYVLAIGYMALFMRISRQRKVHKVMDAFANLGKMSLTNYLLQSIVCTMIFYGYGFGYFMDLGVAAGIAIAVTLFICQLLLANWYMPRFKIGPVEWLLRKFVYLK